MLEVLQRRDLVAILVHPAFVPAGAHGHEKRLAVGGFVLQQLLQEFWLILEMREIFSAELLAFPVELIGQALDEEHAEDEFFELRGIHLPAQDVGSLKEEAFELREGDFVVCH